MNSGEERTKQNEFDKNRNISQMLRMQEVDSRHRVKITVMGVDGNKTKGRPNRKL